jgi:hypothetical protein
VRELFLQGDGFAFENQSRFDSKPPYIWFDEPNNLHRVAHDRGREGFKNTRPRWQFLKSLWGK